MRMTLKFPLRQMDGQWCHKLNKVMDGGRGISQISNKHMIFCHKLGNSWSRDWCILLILLSQILLSSYSLKLLSPYLHNWNPLVTFLIGHSLIILELWVFVLILLRTKMGYCLLKIKMEWEYSLKAKTLFQWSHFHLHVIGRLLFLLFLTKA